MEKSSRKYVTKQQLDESLAQFAEIITAAISEQLADTRHDLERIDRRLEHMNHRKDALGDRVDSHESRITRLEKQNL